jgi:Bacterial Ig-like domain (group 3)
MKPRQTSIRTPLRSRKRSRSSKDQIRFRPSLERFEDRLLLSTFRVSNKSDNEKPGSLRYAIEQANQPANAGSTIAIDSKLFGTIQLTKPLPDLSENVTIEKPASSTILRIGAGSDTSVLFSVLTVDSGVTATLSGLTIRGGAGTAILKNEQFYFIGGGINNSGTLTLTDCTVTGDPSGVSGEGGGIYNHGTLTLTNSTVSGNYAGYGGGIDNYGTLTLTDSTVSGNLVAKYGGGIANHGTLTLTDSTVSGNSAQDGGGGIDNYGALTLTDSTVSGNSATFGGGGIANSAPLTLTDSTVSGNSAGYGGGGIYNYYSGTATLTNVTVTANRSALVGGGIGTEGGSVTLDNTIVDGNFQGASGGTAGDISGSVASTSAYNLIGTGGAGGLINGTNNNQVGISSSDLGTLADNGGPTQTVALLTGSPAVNAGSNSLIPAGITTDQRGPGFARISFGTVDIGAFEFTPTSPTTFTVTNLLDTNTQGTLRFAVTEADADPGSTIGFAAGLTGTIPLSSALPDLSANVTITGPGASTLTVEGGGSGSNFSVLMVEPGVTATVSGLTIANGNVSSYGYGGGICDFGTLTLTGCTVSGNSAKRGGGIANFGTLTLTDSTVSGNSATNGGGIADYSTLTLTDSTISGNSASYGGGIDNFYGTATLTNVTVTANRSVVVGGGIDTKGGSVTLDNTIVDGNFQGASGGTAGDINGSVASTSAYNLIGTGGAGGLTNGTNNNQVGVASPDLGTLADNGGPTQTVALVTGSPAIDAGSNSLVNAGVTNDQRGPGYPRIVSGTVDIGAYESQKVFPFTVMVTNLLDTNTQGTLRYALNEAAAAPGFTVEFAPGLTGTITLGSALPALSASVTIIGSGASMVTVAGGGSSSNFSVLTVDSGVIANVSGLTISDGNLSGNGQGGGISNSGTLTLTDCTVSGNSASFGGGIYNNRGMLTLIDCTVSGNSAKYGGGLFDQHGTITLSDSTISGNSAKYGGGVDSSTGTLALTNCTVSENSANGGGGINNYGTATLTNVTITANRSVYAGGGIENLGGTITLANTIVAGNFLGASPSTTPGDINGSVASTSSYNLIGTGGAGGLTNGTNNNQVGVVNLDLGKLADNGGPTRTIALLNGSPAINGGSNSLIPAGVTTDQRGPGYARITFGTVDIGAFEFTVPASPRTFTVTNLLDTNTQGTLRLAVSEADADLGSTIGFAAGLTGTIPLSSALPDLSANMTIIGPGASMVTVAGGGASSNFSVLTVDSGVTATVSGLTISGGNVAASGDGGGISNSGTLTLSDATVSGNSASVYGGGIFNNGTLTLTDSTVSGNSALFGGGIYDDLDAPALTLTDSTISGNSAHYGGGIHTFVDNLTLTDCTVSGNSSQYGGGIGIYGGTATLTNVTITANRSVNAVGGLEILAGTVTLGNTIVAGNFRGASPSDINGSVAATSSYNLIGTGGTGGLVNGTNNNQVGVANPDLGTLADNGGTTQTVALLTGSPAINGGSDSLIPDGITTDQRGPGYPRIVLGTVDIGAFEFSAPTSPTTFTVTNLLDTNTQGTLRFAITEADADPGSTIGFAAGLTGTIPLSSALPDLSANVTITGPGASTLTVEGGGASSTFGVLTVDSGVTATVSGLTISGGNASAYGYGYGGGINNSGTLTLTNSTVSGNSATYGGGIANDGTLTLTDSTVSGNSALFGGGIYDDLDAPALTLTDSTISGNSAHYGGGIHTFIDNLTLTDCTVSGNSSQYGGGIGIYGGTATLTNVTITANRSVNAGDGPVDAGGGIENDGGTVTLDNTIVAGNFRGATGTTAGDIVGSVTLNSSYNLIGTGGTGGLVNGTNNNQVGVANPDLGTLADNGGPTQTVALLTGSPAINGGSNSLIPAGTTTDQRGPGYPRIVLGTVDIGAFEFSAPTSPTTFTVTNLLDTNAQGTLRFAVTAADADPGSAIEFAAGLTGTIPLSSALPDLSANVTITGPGASTLTVEGGGNGSNFSVLTLDSGVTATVSGLTIVGGHSNNSGGGIADNGILALTDSTVSGNSAGSGGGIYNHGTLTLTDCTVSGNSASVSGGGIEDNDGTLTLTDSTIAGNSASLVGGIDSNHGTLALTASTIAGNSASLVGGINNYAGTLTLTNCIVAGNGSSEIASGSYSGSNNLVGGNALLAPLGNYGGPTQTMPLLPGSPAIAGGTPIAGITSDQRGLALDSPNPDIGAFQSQGFTIATVAGSTPQQTNVLTAFANPLAVSVTAKNSIEPVVGGTIIFSAPASGASATLSTATATIGGNSQASVTATANATGGVYAVTASSAGVAVPATFALTNQELQPVFSLLTGATIVYGTATAALGGTILAGAVVPTGNVSITINGVAQPAGIQSNGSFVVAFPTATLGVAGSPYAITYTYTANAEFLGVTNSSQVLTINKDGTTTALMSSTNPSVFGQSVTFTATLAAVAPGAGTPTGSVTFMDGGTSLGIATLSGGVATFSTNSQSMATHAITAVYGGDANFTTSTSGALSQVVNQDSTSTALTSSVNPAVFGQSVTFVAAVTANAPGAGTPSGTVSFMKGSTILDTAILGMNATVGFSTSALTVGSAQITAVYSGDTDFLTSTSSTTVTINQASTTTSLIASPTSLTSGQSVTLTATIAAVAPGAGTPTGSVKFFVGTTSLGTANLSGNTAILTTAALPVGKDSLTAQYLSDPNFTGSTSSAVIVTVNAGIATTTSVSSSANPSVFGQSVTLTAAVTPSSGNGTPTGSVIFYDGSTALGTATLSSKKASLSMTTLAVGSHAITAVYSGNTSYSPSTSTVLTQTVNKDSSTSKVTSSANPSVYGQSVSLTVTVTAASPGNGTPTGTVTFYDGTANLGTGTLNGATAILSTTFLVVGSHSVTVVYSGDGNFTGSTSPALTQTVNQAGTVTAVVSTVNPSVYGQQLTLTATVSANSPGSGTPTGTVTFSVGSTVLGTATLSSGNASFTTTSPLSVGNDTIKASYGGDTNFKTSAGTVVQTVNQDSTTTSVVSSANPSVYGQSVTFTATVAANAPGSGTPTGSVKFTSGSTTLGTVTLSNGTASYSTAKLATGLDTITATYNGSTSFITSNASLNQTVGQDATSGTVTSSLNPSVFGQWVTFTAIVSAASPGSGTPTGTLKFLDGSTLLTTATLNGSGKATFQTSALLAGSHSITVVYSGDANFVTSTSSVQGQTVKLDATTIKLSSSTGSSVYGQSVTFTATVSANSPGSGTPTGTVTFMDGSTSLGTGTLSGGVATFSISTLTVGSHSITGVYSGDANFTTSTSSTLTQTVKQSSTTTSVVSSANPSTSGQAVTFTATISVSSPGSGTPTGTATFMDGSKTLGTATLSGGTASFTISSLSIGTHSIKVVYSGDTNFKTSTSAALNQVVNNSATVIARSGSGNLVDQVLTALQNEVLDATLIESLAMEQVSSRTRASTKVFERSVRTA